jgi:AcrR family transcriptional regulator
MPVNVATDPHRQAFASRRRDPVSKREAVLQTAAQLFLDKSYGRTSMNDVARKLKITKPALYYYFENKEEILLECYRWGTALIQKSLAEVAAGGTGLEKVRAFIVLYVKVLTVNFGRCVVRLDEGELSAGARAEVRAYKRRIDRTLRSFVQQGIDDGSIKPCDPKLAAFAIAGAVNWMCVWYRPDGDLSAEEIAAQFARTLTEGLARGPKPVLKRPAQARKIRNQEPRR